MSCAAPVTDPNPLRSDSLKCDHAAVEHYVRPDDEDGSANMPAEGRERLHLRLGRWLSSVVADREPSKRQSPNLIRNQDGTGGTVIPSSHSGPG